MCNEYIQENGQQPPLPSHCGIDEITCPLDAFPLRRGGTEAMLRVCLSEKAGSCMFTWPIELKGPGSSLYMVLATKEHDFVSGNDSLRCFNVSLPEHVDGQVSATAITEMPPRDGPGTISWIESTLTHRDPLGNTKVLTGNTVFRNGNDNSCSGRDQCSSWLSMKLNYSDPTCIGTLCRTNVEVSLPGKKMRLVELRVGTNRTICTGLTRNCVLIVDKLYGGEFLVQIRVILPDNQICEFSKTIPSKICGEPPNTTTLRNQTSNILTTEPAPPMPYTLILLVAAIVFCSAVFSTIGYPCVIRTDPPNNQFCRSGTDEHEMTNFSSIEEQLPLYNNPDKRFRDDTIFEGDDKNNENNSLEISIIHDNGKDVT